MASLVTISQMMEKAWVETITQIGRDFRHPIKDIGKAVQVQGY